jgi:H-type lectin domain.
MFTFNEKTHASEWHLNSGTGHRRFRETIKFPEPFTTPPRVAVALTGVDSSNTTNLRIWIEAQDIETHEFDLLVNTWDDTIIYGVSGVWIAE